MLFRSSEVGPGGHYFGTAHTLSRYETAFYSPMLSDWRNFESWSLAGQPTTFDHANRVWKETLAQYEEPPLDDAISEELAAFDEAYRWLMLSLQVADDGADAEQDRARMGRSVPELLKIHPSTLLACAAPITRRAAEAARGHPRLRAWCEARAVEVEAAFRVERRRTMAAGLVVMGLSAAVDARRGRRP